MYYVNRKTLLRSIRLRPTGRDYGETSVT